MSDDFPAFGLADDGKSEGMFDVCCLSFEPRICGGQEGDRSFPADSVRPRPCAALIGTALSNPSCGKFIGRGLMFRMVDLVNEKEDEDRAAFPNRRAIPDRSA